MALANANCLRYRPVWPLRLRGLYEARCNDPPVPLAEARKPDHPSIGHVRLECTEACGFFIELALLSKFASGCHAAKGRQEGGLRLHWKLAEKVPCRHGSILLNGPFDEHLGT